MYTSTILADRIKLRAKEQRIQLKTIWSEIGITDNTLANLRKGSMLGADKLALIADHLDCSVDYLLGRVDTPNGTYSINNHNTTISGTQANVINNTAPDKPDNITEQFFEKFETLSFEEKVDTMQYVNKNYKK